MFQIGYGHNSMMVETRYTLHHGQLQEGLLLEMMGAPAVSRTQAWKELCLATGNEEKSLAELRKRIQYQQPARDMLKTRTNKCAEPKEFQVTP